MCDFHIKPVERFITNFTVCKFNGDILVKQKQVFP